MNIENFKRDNLESIQVHVHCTSCHKNIKKNANKKSRNFTTIKVYVYIEKNINYVKVLY